MLKNELLNTVYFNFEEAKAKMVKKFPSHSPKLFEESPLGWTDEWKNAYI